jgi:hypothetical protein
VPDKAAMVLDARAKIGNGTRFGVAAATSAAAAATVTVSYVISAACAWRRVA